MKITVFTPTYNRCRFLKRLYDSLIIQTFNDFEWVVVDDGSNDSTKELITKFIQENKIRIKYFFQHNSGKHVAINSGAKIAEGELFFFLDSDDFLENNALEMIDKFWNGIEHKKNYLGVSGSIREGCKIIGTTFEMEYLDCTPLELRYKYKVQGDKAEAVRTDLLRKYPFPVINGEKFLTEAIWWNHVSSLGYKMRYFNEVIYICEYLKDGLSYNYRQNMIKNIKSTELYYLNLLSYDIPNVQKENLLIEYLNLLSLSSVNIDKFISRILNNNIGSNFRNIIKKHKGISYKRECENIRKKFNLTQVIENDLVNKYGGSNGAIYGGGEHTERLMKYLPNKLIISKIFDKNPSVKEPEVKGIKVYKLTEESIKNISFIIISSERYEEEIFNEIKDICFRKNVFLYKLYGNNDEISHLIYGELYIR